MGILREVRDAVLQKTHVFQLPVLVAGCAGGKTPSQQSCNDWLHRFRLFAERTPEVGAGLD